MEMMTTRDQKMSDRAPTTLASVMGSVWPGESNVSRMA